MGIVQKLRKKIENLEAKNRMLKRMYESQKAETARALLAQNGAEQVVKCVVAKVGGGIHITGEELEQAKQYEMLGNVYQEPEGKRTFEYLIPALIEEESELKEQETE